MSAHSSASSGRPLRQRLALPLAVCGAVAIAGAVSCSDDAAVPPGPSAEAAGAGHELASKKDAQERFLYVATIAQSTSDPDFIAVIGADPGRPDFGRIVNRVDMPNVGDELHHFGYSRDQRRLVVPGLFSNRIHVFEVGKHGRYMRLLAVNERLAKTSGYSTPHGVFATSNGKVSAPMIGDAADGKGPGGIVEIDDATGEFERFFGPGPRRTGRELGPRYMYDFAALGGGQPRHRHHLRTTGAVRRGHRPHLPRQ